MSQADHDDHLLRAAIGKQMEWFAASDVGMYLLQCAEAEIEDGVEGLKQVNPSDAEAVRKEQNKVWRGESFKRWVVSCVEAGKQSEYILESRDE